MANRFLLSLSLVLVSATGAFAADVPADRNPDLPVEVRVKDLVSRQARRPLPVRNVQRAERVAG